MHPNWPCLKKWSEASSWTGFSSKIKIQTQGSEVISTVRTRGFYSLVLWLWPWLIMPKNPNETQGMQSCKQPTIPSLSFHCNTPAISVTAVQIYTYIQGQGSSDFPFLKYQMVQNHIHTEVIYPGMMNGGLWLLLELLTMEPICLLSWSCESPRQTAVLGQWEGGNLSISWNTRAK